MYQLDRRKFLKLSAAASTSLLFPVTVGCSTRSKISFGLITDSHYADREPAGTRYYRESVEKMAECINVFNEKSVDFVVHLGDFKDEGPDKKESDTFRFLQTLEKEFSRFNGPIYHCIGNHDVDSIRKSQFLENVENTGIDKGRSYYSYDAQGFHFIVLDANYHKDGRDQFYAEGADWQDPNIPDFELDWLMEDLAKNSLPTVVFCHHPLFDYPEEGVNMSVNNFKEVQKAFEGTQVLAVFQGHVHEEFYTQIDGIHYCTQLGMVDYSGLDNNSFSIVTIENGEIRVDGYKRVKDQLL